MKKSQTFTSVMTKADVEQFRRAADAYGKRHTRSRKAALKELVQLGIYTRAGRLTKNYR
jgi:hypothetical protein